MRSAHNQWIDDRARELRPSTLHDYRGVAKRLRAHFGENTPAASVDVGGVNAYRERLLEEGLSARTTNKILTLLHGVLRLAMERHGLAANPVALARKVKPRPRTLGQYLTAPEIAQLVAQAPSDQEAVLYEVAAWTGLRWGELRALRWGGVRFTDALIYVNRNWPVHGVEGAPKSGKPRAVPLDDDVAGALARLAEREAFTDDEDYVFVQEAGQPLGYDWTTRRFKVARDAAGLVSPRAGAGDLTFHDLRHTDGTLAAAIYRDLRRVQEYMGHASITTTELYAHFMPQTDAAARATAGRRAMLGTVQPTVQPTRDFSTQLGPTQAS